MMTSALTCTACRSERTETTVQRGSYVLRCGVCGEDVLATSFMAMLDTDYEFSAYRDPGHGQPPLLDALIASGPLRDIAAAIRSVASDGTTVLLISRA